MTEILLLKIVILTKVQEDAACPFKITLGHCCRIEHPGLFRTFLVLAMKVPCLGNPTVLRKPGQVHAKII